MSDSTGPLTLTGACQCGRVRFSAHVETNEAYYCHCRMCQRAVGNVRATFVNVKKDAVTWEGAPRALYASSTFARRGFCSTCGTPLSFEYLESKNMDLCVGALDKPELLKPTSHFGVESIVKPFHIEDGLPGKRIDEIEHIMKKWHAAYGADVTPGPRT